MQMLCDAIIDDILTIIDLCANVTVVSVTDVTQNAAEFTIQCDRAPPSDFSARRPLHRDQRTGQGQHEELLAQHPPLPDHAARVLRQPVAGSQFRHGELQGCLVRAATNPVGIPDPRPDLRQVLVRRRRGGHRPVVEDVHDLQRFSHTDVWERQPAAEAERPRTDDSGVCLMRHHLPEHINYVVQLFQIRHQSKGKGDSQSHRCGL